MQAWYAPKSPPLLKQTWKQASAGSFAKFCSRQPVIFVQHCGQKLLAMWAVFKITGAAASSKRTCGESRNRHQKKVGSRRRCRNAKAAPSVPPVPLTVQSLSLTVLSLSSRCRFHVAVTLSLSLHRFRSSMNGNRSQRLSHFGHFNRLSIT